MLVYSEWHPIVLVHSQNEKYGLWIGFQCLWGWTKPTAFCSAKGTWRKFLQQLLFKFRATMQLNNLIAERCWTWRSLSTAAEQTRWCMASHVTTSFCSRSSSQTSVQVQVAQLHGCSKLEQQLDIYAQQWVSIYHILPTSKDPLAGLQVLACFYPAAVFCCLEFHLLIVSQYLLDLTATVVVFLWI